MDKKHLTVLVLMIVVLVTMAFMLVQKNQNKPSTENVVYSGSSKQEKLSIKTYLLDGPILNFALEVPSTWRATLADDMPMRFSAFNYNLARLKFIAPDRQDESSNIKPVSHLDFYDGTGVVGPSPEQRNYETHPIGTQEAFFKALIAMRKTKSVEELPDCFAVSRECSQKWRNIYLETGDGTFSGFGQLRGNAQSYDYLPSLEVYLAGKINNKIVYIEGVFQIYDAHRTEIERQIKSGSDITALTKNSLDQLVDGPLAKDTQKQIDQVIEVLESVRVTVSERR